MSGGERGEPSAAQPGGPHPLGRWLLDLGGRERRSGPLASTIAEATGRERRNDPVLPRTGGPAGNAALTAWTGLVLLVLSIAELLTLFNVSGLLSWHVVIGALLVPPAVMKTGSTGWRLTRYYLGNEPYQRAGPPPLLLRLLGPLVVLSTLALLGSGVLLIILGEQSSRQDLFSILGQRVSWLSVHQVVFAAWCVATGLHLLNRIVPALRLTVRPDSSRTLPGGQARAALLTVSALLAVVLAVVLIQADGTWGQDDVRHGSPGAAHD